jgi:hypothetical protein
MQVTNPVTHGSILLTSIMPGAPHPDVDSYEVRGWTFSPQDLGVICNDVLTRSVLTILEVQTGAIRKFTSHFLTFKKRVLGNLEQRSEYLINGAMKTHTHS